MSDATSADAPGTVVVSVDAELGWGHHDLATPPHERVEYARTGWIRLLDSFDEYDVPATWAVVGHLFLEDCDGVHADHPAPPAWFERERGAWADRPDLRFGPDLVDRIETAAADHEVGCHTFSHVRFDAPETTAALARAELRASERAAGRSFESFVFPRNGVGHRDALADAGYACYRGTVPPSRSAGPSAFALSALSALAGDDARRRARKLVGGLAGRAPPLVRPTLDEYGLVNVPASLYCFGFGGAARAVVESTAGDPIVRRVRAGLDAAADRGGVLHLWLHPNNVYNDRHARRLEGVLSAVAARRDAGDVAVETMGSIAARVRERAGERGDAAPGSVEADGPLGSSH